MNPYFITVPPGAAKGPNGTLTNAGSSTVAYLQLDLTRRWVFDPDYLEDSLTNASLNFWDGFTFLHPKAANWTPDLQVQLGFLLGNGMSSSTNTTYSAQTLAGSDIYMQLGGALPIWRNNWQTNDPINVQVAIGGSWGITTEMSFEKIHFNQFYGGIADFSIPFGVWQSTNSLGKTLIEIKGGYAELDYPSLSGTANQVNLDGNGVPIFFGKWAPEMGVNAFIPIGNNLFFNMEANAFINDQYPNQWNVKIGATIPFDKFPTMLKGLAGM